MWLAVAIVAALAAAVLFVPIQLELSIVKEERSAAARVRGHVRWLFVSFSIGASNSRRRPSKSVSPTNQKPAPARRMPRFIRTRLRNALTSPGFVHRTLRLIVSYLRLARPDKTRVDVRAGFDDPAETGMLAGSALAVSSAAGWRHVRITPEFLEPVLAGRVEMKWSRSVATLAWPLLPYAVFILSRRSRASPR